MPEGTASLSRGQKPEGSGEAQASLPAGVAQGLPGCRGDAARGKGVGALSLALAGVKEQRPEKQPRD